ncbi:MAG: PDZ domain-containing protein [Acidobacteriia bacterium]|nr:PDZ domain-containing protein [Terriglobia bacterium]
MNRIFVLFPLLAISAAAQDAGQEQLMLQVQQLEKLKAREIATINAAVMGPSVKGAPYSGLETVENRATLGDGTNIHHMTQTMVYRDSEGRVRRETPDSVTIWDPVANASYMLDPKNQTARKMPLGMAVFNTRTGANGQVVYRAQGFPNAPPEPPPLPPLAGNGSIGIMFTPTDSERSRALLEANGLTEGVFVQQVQPGSPAEKAGIESGDVITGMNGKAIHDGNDLTTTISAMPLGSTAGVSAVRNGKAESFQVTVADRAKVFVAASLPGGMMGKDVKTESLGQQTIGGVNATGTRMTSTIEAGEIGNDRPIQNVMERWYSPELQTDLKRVRSDPRTGTETFELSNISRTEPSPDLFQVPPGYQMVGRP